MAPVIGYAGMTHLGLNSAVAAAARGFKVVCFDPDPALIDALARGELGAKSVRCLCTLDRTAWQGEADRSDLPGTGSVSP